MKYICELCGTVYDEDTGDTRRGIPARTPFSVVPQSYTCPTCGSEKEAFTQARPNASIRQQSGSREYVKYSDDRRESER